MTDQSNTQSNTDYNRSHKKREGLGAPKGEKAEDVDKKIEKVVTGEVIVKKRGFLRKIGDIYTATDLKGVAYNVITEILIPGFKNMVYDGMTRGVERAAARMVFRNGAPGRPYGAGPTYRYNAISSSPIQHRPYSEITQHQAPPLQIGPRSRSSRGDILLSSKTDAQNVLDLMNELTERYGKVTVADLNEILGIPVEHVDHKWGWVFLGGATVRGTREGFLLDLPAEEPITS